MASLRPRLIGNISETDLKNLRIFRQVADAGGITIAADRTGMEKSTISRALSALEQRLDGSLAERGPSGFSLTEYGKSVYTAAISFEDAMTNLRTEINGARKRLTGSVSIGIADNLITNVDAKISDTLERFFDEAPGVDVTLKIFPPDRLLTALMDRQLNIAIMAEWLTTPSLSKVALFDEAYGLYACPRPGQTVPHVNQLQSRGIGVVVRDFHGGGAVGASRKVQGAWEAKASGLEAVATLVNTGRCVGFLPRHYVEGTRTRYPFEIVPGSEDLRKNTRFVAAFETARTRSHAMNLMLNLMEKTMLTEALTDEAI